MTRIGFIVLLSALAVAPLAPAAAQDLLWNYQTGSNSNDVSRAVAVDSAGNAYIVGRTSESLFGQVFGRGDAFVAKIDPSGALLWSRQFGTAESEEAEGVAVDKAGSVYIVGLTGGSLGQPNAGVRDLYLTKFDASGALVWTRQEGTSSQDYGTGVALDNAGNVYISGGTSGSLFEQSAGNYDAFVAKYDASGALLWAHHLGTPAKDYSHGVAVDSAGSVFITGWTEGILGASQHGSRDAFVAKYNALGTLLWTRQFGGSGNEEGFGVAMDSAGNVFVTGYREKGWGAFFRDQDDLFLTKYDSRGTYLWMNHIGLQHKEWAQAVAVIRKVSARMVNLCIIIMIRLSNNIYQSL
ncbi:MAG: SBBP repeat-containing protein [Planctomycetes bacterium]|nr:SBBP repeat-containing protein [Planctomycetota bacterium]